MPQGSLQRIGEITMTIEGDNSASIKLFSGLSNVLGRSTSTTSSGKTGSGSGDSGVQARVSQLESTRSTATNEKQGVEGQKTDTEGKIEGMQVNIDEEIMAAFDAKTEASKAVDEAQGFRSAANNARAAIGDLKTELASLKGNLTSGKVASSTSMTTAADINQSSSGNGTEQFQSKGQIEASITKIEGQITAKEKEAADNEKKAEEALAKAKDAEGAAEEHTVAAELALLKQNIDKEKLPLYFSMITWLQSKIDNVSAEIKELTHSGQPKSEDSKTATP